MNQAAGSASALGSRQANPLHLGTSVQSTPVVMESFNASGGGTTSRIFVLIDTEKHHFASCEFSCTVTICSVLRPSGK